MAEKKYIECEAAMDIFACGKEIWRDYEAAACIAALPAADVVPAVRCKECRNYVERSGACAYLVVGMREDDFCSYGSKKEV